jgi:bacterioferritin-associated ferredoxin
LQKAETELQKMNLPDADKQTRRAVAEQLRKVQQQAEQSGRADQAGKAAGQMAEGLENGSQQSFRDGTQNLAAEAGRQAGQKKLSEMLQQQSESLAQLRADLESQAGNIAQGQGKGGRRAGKGSSGDPRGDASGKAAAAQELRLKGENSGQGDSETEMLAGEREEQPAEREYRANLQRYESLQESSLDSEPVPAGQKQLIRRYFQLIRPVKQPAPNRSLTARRQPELCRQVWYAATSSEMTRASPTPVSFSRSPARST